MQMRILIEDLPVDEEEQIIIRCNGMNDELLQLVGSIKTKQTKFIGYKGEEIYRVYPQEIYYFEAVDNKVFLYCHKRVLEVKQKLYEIEDSMAHSDFLRVSKSVILNVSKIKQLRPAFSGRFEAELDNGEKIIISRQYVPNLKKKFGII